MDKESLQAVERSGRVRPNGLAEDDGDVVGSRTIAAPAVDLTGAPHGAVDLGSGMGG